MKDALPIHLKRLEWADIFKGLAILFVVYGHIGGIGQYVYQFHMAAFFFISGYLTDFRKYSWSYFLCSKIYTLLLPFLTVFLIFAGGIALLKTQGWETLFFSVSPPSFGVQLRALAGNMACYIDWLGASWFLFALFFAFLIQKIVYFCCGNRGGLWYALVSGLLYCLGMFLFDAKEFLPYDLDLALAGQGYLALGVLAKEWRAFEKISASRSVFGLIFVYSILGLWFFGDYHFSAIFYPTRKVEGGFLAAFLAALNGIVFCYCVARGLERVPLGWVRKFFILCGKGSLGILFFHFLMFKVAYAILALYGVLSWGYLVNLVPEGYEVILRYGFLIFAVSVIGSLVLWNFLLCFRWFRFLLGHDRKSMERIYGWLTGMLKHVWRHLEAPRRSLARWCDGSPAGRKMHRYWPQAIVALALLGLNAWILSPRNRFVFDDYSSWYRAKFWPLFSSFTWLPASAHDDRPVRDVFMNLAFNWSGDSVFICHLLLYVIHLGNCVLLYVAINRYMRLLHRENKQFALLSVLLWGAWPTALLASFWLSGIHDSLGLTMFLALVLVYYSMPASRWLIAMKYLAVAVLYYLLLRTKEMFVVVPAAILILDLLKYACERKPAGIKGWLGFRPTVLTGLLWLIMVGYIYVLLVMCGNPAGAYDISFAPNVVALNLVRYFTMYFDFTTIHMMFNPTPVFKYVACGVPLYVLFALWQWFRHKNPFYVAMFLLFACFISTVLILKTQTHILYLYVPSVFSALVMGWVLARWTWRINRYVVLVLLAAGLYLLLYTPGVVQLRNYWAELGETERIAIEHLRRQTPPADHTTVVVMLPKERYNLFTYGPAMDKSYFLNVAFQNDNLYRVYMPERIDISKPYVICRNYPEIEFCDLPTYLDSSRPEVSEISPASATVNQPFNRQPNGESAISIIGKNFTPACKVYFNGIPGVGQCVANSELITSFFPKELLAQPGVVNIIVSDGEQSVDYVESAVDPNVWERVTFAHSSEPFYFNIQD